MAGTLTVDTIQSDSSYSSTLNVASKINFTSGMQIGGQDTTFGGMRNRIINGDMRIDQRTAGASATATEWGYSLDRWVNYLSVAGKFSFRQMNGVDTGASNYEANSTPPGFTNSVKLTSLSAYTIPAGGERYLFSQIIEGYNIADLAWGTASAKAASLSFWVKSSLTGTFSGSISSTGQDASFPYSYTINQANTWEYKTISIPGPTTSSWNSSNGRGLWLFFDLGTGSTSKGVANGTWQGTSLYSATGAVSLVGTNAATLYLTGVQFEKGSVASAFEQLHYGHLLALCQRYYYKQSGASQYIRLGTGFVGAGSTTTLYAMVNFPVTMRAKPTSVDWAASLGVWNGGGIASVSNVTLESGSESTTTAVAVATSTGLTAQQPYQLIGNSSSTAALAFNAELNS